MPWRPQRASLHYLLKIFSPCEPYFKIRKLYLKSPTNNCRAFVKKILIEFWLISNPEVETLPAFAALPGPNRILASRNTLMASIVDGILAPSETQKLFKISLNGV